MLKFFKGASAYQAIVWTIIIIGTVISILPPELFFFKVISKFVVQIMLAYFIIGLLFLFFSDEKSMFVSFTCCAVLCLFLRTRSAFFAAPQAGPSVTALNCNLSLSNSDNIDSTIQSIINSNADVISIQEVTPDWGTYLANHPVLNAKYPYDTAIIRMDFHGLALYSKYPFAKVDTFHYKEIPNLAGCIKHDSLNKHIYFVSSHTIPPVSLGAHDEINAHLQTVANYVKQLKEPVITLGDYQVMPWSPEIVSFRRAAKLSDSRRDMPMSYFPYDHIFYSKELQCIDFGSINNMNEHFGVKGAYQLKSVQ
jgi:endonuclease/exonuclease/phosphatase (EEP) superfamily protein YafD